MLHFVSMAGPLRACAVQLRGALPRGLLLGGVLRGAGRRPAGHLATPLLLCCLLSSMASAGNAEAAGEGSSVPGESVAGEQVAGEQVAIQQVAAKEVAGAKLPGQDGEGRGREFSRPYGAIEFGVGILALPDARVCGDGGCDRGDVSLEVDAWPLFRASPSFAVGAGITLALTPTQDVPQRNVPIPREHSRRYFQAEGIGRYYFLHGQALEWWLGASTGLVVVSDNFRTRSAPPDLTLIGQDSANIATEGLTLGVGTGVTFGVNDVLQIGGTLRLARWFLPSSHESIAFGEEASLGDRVTMLNLSLVVAYHGR
jgi:hypothetical protein